jgi:hypothetical protein
VPGRSRHLRECHHKNSFASGEQLGDEAAPRYPDGHMATPDLDGIFSRLQAGGAAVVQVPTDQPYGVRDCAVRDPAGNVIRIHEVR